MPKRVSVPSFTLKPANSMVASLGIGINALSSVISTKTPAYPASPIRLVANSTSLSVTAPVRSTRPVTGAGW